MKRLPLFVSFLAVVALSASLAYWTLQLFKPQQRPLAAVASLGAPEASPEAAAGLFGGRLQAAALSNYQLKGVVAAADGRGSVAILASDSKPAQAYPVGAEVAPGVVVKEVQPRFVLLADGGVPKRVELAQEAGRGDAPPLSAAPPLPPPQPPQGQPQPPQQPPVQMAPPSRIGMPAPGAQR
ncbi:type II secretion system protein N [Janthinobacterium fluminis]|uniref:Type II secretion system protein N n=1 Tax=Janthinobacterium fluminis TaxID=2987524 RepID=A0ABT5K731_9BURK|nr:type II secretion system protein N [Janthinobacterium fluminis]MDC8760455.1 type II secretion system protein N [Janthinobacterium fluminis]